MTDSATTQLGDEEGSDDNEFVVIEEGGNYEISYVDFFPQPLPPHIITRDGYDDTKAVLDRAIASIPTMSKQFKLLGICTPIIETTGRNKGPSELADKGRYSCSYVNPYDERSHSIHVCQVARVFYRIASNTDLLYKDFIPALVRRTFLVFKEYESIASTLQRAMQWVDDNNIELVSLTTLSVFTSTTRNIETALNQTQYQVAEDEFQQHLRLICHTNNSVELRDQYPLPQWTGSQPENVGLMLARLSCSTPENFFICSHGVMVASEASEASEEDCSSINKLAGRYTVGPRVLWNVIRLIYAKVNDDAPMRSLQRQPFSDPEYWSNRQQQPGTVSNGTNKDCVVCLEKPVDSLILPCRHLVMCSECVGQLTTCPICRGSIQSTLIVFT